MDDLMRTAVILCLTFSCARPAAVQRTGGEKPPTTDEAQSTQLDFWGDEVFARLERAGKDCEAELRILDAAIAERPDSIWVDDFLLLKARALRYLGRVPEATEILRALVVDYPLARRNSFPTFRLMASRSGGMFACGYERLFREYLDAWPIRTMDDARYELAEIYSSEDEPRYEKAIIQLDAILKANKGSYEAIGRYVGSACPWRGYQDELSRISRPERRARARKVTVLEKLGKFREAAEVAFEILQTSPFRIPKGYWAPNGVDLPPRYVESGDGSRVLIGIWFPGSPFEGWAKRYLDLRERDGGLREAEQALRGLQTEAARAQDEEIVHAIASAIRSLNLPKGNREE